MKRSRERKPEKRGNRQKQLCHGGQGERACSGSVGGADDPGAAAAEHSRLPGLVSLTREGGGGVGRGASHGYYRDYPQLRNPKKIMVPVNLARRLASRPGRALPGVGRREMHPLGQGARSPEPAPALGRAASLLGRAASLLGVRSRA